MKYDTVNELEKLVDDSSLLDVLAALELLCLERAMLITHESPNDPKASNRSRSWKMDGKRISNILPNIKN